MLVTLFAIAIGSLIGRARGGRWSGVSSAELRSTPLLIIAIATVLVQAVLNPVLPVLWSLVSVITLIGFGFRNRHLAGMSLIIIGAFLNLFPLLANWATPVSELALTSVGDLNPFGDANISGARESSAEATRLRFLGDAIPVPVFGSVVSIGDLIALVGLADIFTNLFLRARSQDLSLSQAGVSFETPQHSAEPVSILSPLETGIRRSSDSERRRPKRNKAAPVSHSPAHAAPSLTPDLMKDSSEHVPAHAIILPELTEPEVPPAPTGRPVSTEPDFPIVIDLSEDGAPAHAAPGGIIETAATTPSHALVTTPDDETDTPDAQSIDETESNAATDTANEPSADPAADPIAAAGIHAVPVTPTVDEAPVPEPVPELIDLTDPNDPRPIIDLTKSPTDEQMTEFLRRRKAADREHARVSVRPPGQRRGRAPVKIRTDNTDGVVETTR